VRIGTGDGGGCPTHVHCRREGANLPPGPLARGSTFDQIIASFLGRQRFTFEVTGYGPNGLLELRATSGPVRPIVTYRVESTGQGTRLTARIDVHTRGCFGSWSHR
jgi:hypothetical protein